MSAFRAFVLFVWEVFRVLIIPALAVGLVIYAFIQFIKAIR